MLMLTPNNKHQREMKTPIQEAEEYILGILKESEVDMGTYGLIELKFREMSKKEKEVMSEIYAHDVSQQRELLEAYTQFLWTQHNNLTDADNNKLALEKFIASYCG